MDFFGFNIPNIGGEYLFYAVAFVSIALLLYGIYFLYSKLKHEQTNASALYEQKQKIESQISELSVSFAEGKIQQEEYGKAFEVLQKKKLETNEQIKEFERKKALQEKVSQSV